MIHTQTHRVHRKRRVDVRHVERHRRGMRWQTVSGVRTSGSEKTFSAQQEVNPSALGSQRDRRERQREAALQRRRILYVGYNCVYDGHAYDCSF